jgi:hypothetical protein
MRHFETKHGDLKHKPLEYFQRKLSDLSASKGQIMSFSGINMMAVEASYKVSLGIAKAGKPHTVGESLLLPSAKDMASNIKEQLKENVEASKYYTTQLEFWLARRNEYPRVSEKSLNFILLHNTTYLCERGFSSVICIRINAGMF